MGYIGLLLRYITHKGVYVLNHYNTSYSLFKLTDMGKGIHMLTKSNDTFNFFYYLLSRRFEPATLGFVVRRVRHVLPLLISW